MTDRSIRYRDLLPTDRLRETAATVIGVGAIGRQVALQLAAMGVGALQLVDFDHVEPANLGVQAYRIADLGRPKVEATGDACVALNDQLQLELVAARFSRSLVVHPVLLCCVDAIDTRRLIWQGVRDRVNWFGDARMAAESLRILVACDDASRAHYPTTLFAAAEAHHAPCTAKATVYCANIAAGMLLAQFTRWLRHMPTDPDLQLNLLASELTVHL